MSCRRFLLLPLCFSLWSGFAAAVSLEIAGAPNPEELVCPRFVSAAAT
ncbi:MAG: hypothetical protein RIR00_1234, partial [Pseudomonadota bacterium]